MGKAERSKNNKIKAEESFPISEQGYTMGKLLDGTECQILLDTGASKYFMSKIILYAMQVTPQFAQICIKKHREFR